MPFPEHTNEPGIAPAPSESGELGQQVRRATAEGLAETWKPGGGMKSFLQVTGAA